MGYQNNWLGGMVIEEMKASVGSGEREIICTKWSKCGCDEVMVRWTVLEDTGNIEDSVEIGQTTVRAC